jgi:hypothetical protein
MPRALFYVVAVVEMVMIVFRGGGGNKRRCSWPCLLCALCIPSLLLPTSHEGNSRSPWLGLLGAGAAYLTRRPLWTCTWPPSVPLPGLVSVYSSAW